VAEYNRAVPTSRLQVIAHIHARPEHVASVRDVLTGYVEPTRAEPGCFVYDLLQDSSDPAHFTFVEEWADATALEAHSKSAHITAGRARLQGLTASPNQVVRYTRLA